MKKKQVYVLTAICLLLIIGYISGAYYFKGHFYPGTVINGVEVGKMDLNQAKDSLQKRLTDQTLSVKEGEVTETLEKLPISMNLDDADKLVGESCYTWLFELSKEHAYEIPTQVDDAQVETMARNLQCFKHPKKEHTAYLNYNGSRFEIVPEVYGMRVKNRAMLFQAVSTACKNLQDSIDLEEFFYKPLKTSKNKVLNKSLEYANGFMDLGIFYEFGSVKEELSNDQIADMIKIKKSGKAILDEEMVKDFIKSLEAKYDTSYTVRDFKTHSGSVVKIYDGDYGWFTNTPESVDKLLSKLKNKEGGKAELVYRETAVNYSHDGPEYGDTYVEISISGQTLYLYKDGSCILSTPIVSGCVNKGRGTPRGMYPITYKELHHRMIGEDYDVNTTYWMPFNGNVGIHDATWRSSFGGSQYINNGSHGCVNIPLWAASTIYKNVSKGTAVIVY